MTSTSGRYHLTLAQQPRDAFAPGAGASDVERADQESGEGSQLLRVGDLAKMTGKTVRAIHHYEELGLIEPVGRSKGHYRLFDAETPVRIRWIGKLQSLGLSLGEIRTLVRTRQASPSALQAAGQLRRMYEEKLVEVRGRLAELTQLERELQASLAYLDACGTSCTPELVPADCAQCDRHAQGERPAAGSQSGAHQAGGNQSGAHQSAADRPNPAEGLALAEPALRERLAHEGRADGRHNDLIIGALV